MSKKELILIMSVSVLKRNSSRTKSYKEILGTAVKSVPILRVVRFRISEGLRLVV
jgi:hypothetical protein